MRIKRWPLAAWSAVTVLALACTGRIGDDGTGTTGPGGPGSATASIGKSGMRRLTRREYDATLKDLLKDDTGSGFKALPEDVRDPFDNDFTTQQASQPLIESAESLAQAASARLLANVPLRDALVGCKPTGPGDAACMKSFIASFGRRALRRPLTDEEITRYQSLQSLAVEDANFYTGVDSVIRALLQEPEFLYRVEVGTPLGDKSFRLNSYEVATRLSYFFWGTTPDDALLDAATKDELKSSAQVRAAAGRLITDPRARERVARFHALWLGYDRLPHPADLTSAMQTESASLVSKVVFDDKRPWQDIFKSDETFVNDLLAKQYGLPAPGASGATWVKYGATGRKGILSHGSFLSVAGKFGDTSPTQRGILIRTRLLCQNIPPPPPSVNTDMPPTSPTGKCKSDRYAAHRAGGCAGCHNNMDPVGFGLENYDQAGVYRTTDNGAPECTITGEGEVVGVGKFKGPAELGDRLIDSGLLEHCLVTQVYRFAMGHREADDDAAYIDRLSTAFKTNGYKFDQLMIDLVSAEDFLYRKEE